MSGLQPRETLIPPSKQLPTQRPPADRAEDDVALARRCVAGDKVAWRALYDAHFRAVDRLIRALGIGEAEADDLCQEIFVIVFRHLRTFRGDARLSTWIHRLTVREAIRFAKRRRLRARLADLFYRQTELPLPADWSETDAGRRQYLQQLLARLSPERRMALVLHEVEGLSVGEIAEVCGCAENTVWTRIHRARADLEKLAQEIGT